MNLAQHIFSFLSNTINLIGLFISNALPFFKPQIVYFKVNRKRVAKNEYLYCTWNIKNASNIQIIVNSQKYSVTLKEDLLLKNINQNCTIKIIAKNLFYTKEESIEIKVSNFIAKSISSLLEKPNFITLNSEIFLNPIVKCKLNIETNNIEVQSKLEQIETIKFANINLLKSNIHVINENISILNNSLIGTLNNKSIKKTFLKNENKLLENLYAIKRIENINELQNLKYKLLNN